MKEQNQKLLTVSVAAYNAEGYLREVLDSFVGLKRTNDLEVFVVDDGGTDSSLNIAKEYEEKYPGVFYAIHKENGGWGSTVNYSICHAHGKYFRLLDGDDYYNKHNFERFLDYIDTLDADMIISPFSVFRDGEKEKSETGESFDESYLEGQIYPFETAEKCYSLAMHSITVRTEVLVKNKVELKQKCLYRDMEYTANILLHAQSIAFFKDPIYFYRIGRDGQSISKASYIKHMAEHADITLTILEKSEQTKDPARIKKMYELAEGSYVQQIKIYFYPPISSATANQLKGFMKNVREKHPAFYSDVQLPSSYRILHKTGYIMYYPLKTLMSIKHMLKKK